MANDKRTFYCMPRRAIMDPDLSALDHRVLGVIAIHDGMSTVKGSGAGCVASNRTLHSMVGCDYTSLSRSIGRLLRRGYITREQQLLDKRKFTFRVSYSAAEVADNPPEDGLPSGQPIRSEVVGGLDNNWIPVLDETANDPRKIVGGENFETRTNLPKTAEHYIPLRGVIDFVETREIDSAKLRVLTRQVADHLSTGRESREESSRGLSGMALHRDGEPLNETLAKFERQWRQDWTAYRGNLREWADWLTDQADSASDDGDHVLSGWARRLADDVSQLGWETLEITEEAA